MCIDVVVVAFVIVVPLKNRIGSAHAMCMRVRLSVALAV